MPHAEKLHDTEVLMVTVKRTDQMVHSNHSVLNSHNNTSDYAFTCLIPGLRSTLILITSL